MALLTLATQPIHIAERKRKDPAVWRGLFSVSRDAALLVAATNATGHRRSIWSMDFRDPHRAVAACIGAADIDRNSRTVMMTPIAIVPAVVTVAPTILSGRWRNHRKQRQRCQSDKSCLHYAFSSGYEVQRSLCCDVPKN